MAVCLGGALLLAAAQLLRTRWSEGQAPDFGLSEARAQGGPSPNQLTQLWATRRLPERRAVWKSLSDLRATNTVLQELWGTWLPEAALDPDDGLRLHALGGISGSDGPAALNALAWALADADPEMRTAALHDLQRAANRQYTPWVLPLLDDPDLKVGFVADSVLRTWTDRDSGLRLAMILSPEGAETNLLNRTRLTQAATEWRAWWAGQTPQAANPAPPPPAPVVPRPTAPPVSFTDLDGRRVRLSDFAGKIVLLNFWTTWCSACIPELPTLAELQRRHRDDLVILGVSLDAPDPDPAGDNDEDGAPGHRTRAEILAALRKAVTKYGINYPVLWDPAMESASAFFGGELPTQVLIDRRGRLVRRFLGARSPEVWEALLKESGRPAE